jgi:pSer/pThr/pTyr-binding forkhead associated (FHA) protein
VTPASLVIHQGAGAGSEHSVDGELILGRDDATADLVISDPGVSRRHARVMTEDGAVILEDLGSSNGTYVNGERISGAVELTAGDEIQIGATFLGVGGTAATAIMPPGAPVTEQHPGPARPQNERRPQEPPPDQPPPAGRAAPRRLAPHPSEGSNIPALSALFLGPLSLLLLFLSAGGFFLALPCGIAAIVLGGIGIRNVDRGKATSHRGLARLGRITGWIGTTLSILALIAFIVVATLLNVTADSADSVSGLIDAIRDEIEGIEVPDVNTPDVNAPEVDAPDVNAPDPGSGGEGGAEPGGTPAPPE